MTPRGSPRLEERAADAPPVVPAGGSFDGRLAFRGVARVEGELRGEVRARGLLVIGERARVEAWIEVDELVVAGELAGEVYARRRVELLPSARVTAQLRTPRLVLAEGCLFEGRCETVPEAAETPAIG